MLRIVAGSTHGLADADGFIRLLEGLPAHRVPAARDLFVRGEPIVVARAPGRLDVMGGISDYSGSLVLEMPIREATFAAIQFVSSPFLRIVSLGGDQIHRTPSFEMPLAELMRGGEPISYEAARRYFGGDPRTHWAAYVVGCWLVLTRERGVRFEHGANVLIDSAVPEGKSVSSSAALEVATFNALFAALLRTQHSARPQHLAPRDLALLCQTVENRVVGAPCGVMDQMTSACGRDGQIMALKCQPAELLDPIHITPDLAVWGLDSGVRHSVGGSDYRCVRIGAFMGYRIIAALAKLPVHDPGSGEPVIVEDPKWGGYLCNITPDEFEARFAPLLPERMSGEAFLARYGQTTDPVTRVDPAVTYAVRTPTAHPIHENARVQGFSKLLGETSKPGRLRSMGDLMYESHASYSGCGLGSEATDQLVDLVREAGSTQGLFGAKITGGGSGGTVAVLGRHDARHAIESVTDAYAAQTGYRPYIFTGSSPGACEFGTMSLLLR